MRVTPYERGQVRDGAAWLPCNPLEIVEHAARLAGGGAYIEINHRGSLWLFDLIDSPHATVHECPHTAAVALLREVVGG